MAKTETCPACGDLLTGAEYGGEFVMLGSDGRPHTYATCLRCQLAQRDARIAELEEAEASRAAADRAAWERYQRTMKSDQVQPSYEDLVIWVNHLQLELQEEQGDE